MPTGKMLRNGARILVWVSVAGGVLAILSLLGGVSYKVFAKDAAQDVTIAVQGQQIEINTETLKGVAQVQRDNHTEQMEILRLIRDK